MENNQNTPPPPPPSYTPPPMQAAPPRKIQWEKVLSLSAIAVSVVSASIIIVSYFQNREHIKLQKALTKVQLDKEIAAAKEKKNGGTNNFTGEDVELCKGAPNNSMNCNEKILPVMGCDGRAYANPCFAKKNGVKKWKKLNYS